MAEVITYKNNKVQCFCQVKLDSGERVLISIASFPSPSVKLIRLGFMGLLPKETIWEYSAARAGGPDSYVNTLMSMLQDPTATEPKHPLDVMRDRLLSLGSIVDVKKWFEEALKRAEQTRVSA
jgi:hypothetical protein